MLSNFLYQLLYQILGLILPLITVPYTSRVLGVEGIGTYSYSFAIVSYFMAFANMGVNIYGNREIAAVQYDKGRRSQQFWNLLIVQLMFSSISLLIYLVLVIWGNWENKIIFLMQGIYILGQAFDINWFFFGMEKFKITVTRNMLVKLVTTILIFGVIKEPADLEKYILILALGTTIGNSTVWLLVRTYIDWKKPQFHSIKKLIKPTIILMIPSFAVKMYTQMDKVFIKMFSDVQQVGYYENSEKIVNIAFVLVTALSTILLPRMANLYANKKIEQFRELFHRSSLIVVWITIAVMFGMAGVANTFVKIYLGIDYLPCIMIIMILAVTIPFKGGAEIVRRGYIIPTKSDRIYVISVFVGAGINVLFNLAFIPLLGAVGAALGTVIAEIMVFLIQVLMIRKDIVAFPICLENIICVCAGIIMFILIKKLETELFQWSHIERFLLQVVLGVVVYLACTGIPFFLIRLYRKK